MRRESWLRRNWVDLLVSCVALAIGIVIVGWGYLELRSMGEERIGKGKIQAIEQLDENSWRIKVNLVDLAEPSITTVPYRVTFRKVFGLGSAMLG